MNKEVAEMVIDRDKMIEEFQSSLRNLFVKNVEGRRTYLHTLLLIVFVASGFTITIQDYIEKWGILVSVTLYLVSAIVICVYLSFLLVKEGRILDEQLKFVHQQRKDLLEAVANEKIKDFETFEAFREEKSREELDRKHHLKNDSDLWFWLINILFILGTSILLLAYILNQYCKGY